MEYWTGVELSDNFTQVYQKSYHIHIYSDMINNTIYFLTFQADIKNFRPKLAAILLSSDLNKRKRDVRYIKIRQIQVQKTMRLTPVVLRF